MRSRLIIWLLALAGAAVVLYLGTPTEDVYWSDFDMEAWPAFDRLAHGDLAGFLQASPLGYAGSMVIRAPLGAIAGLLNLSEPGLYRLTALPGLLALAAVAAYLGMKARNRGGHWWLLVVALAGASPLAWKAVWFGHAEELLTTGLVVGAVLVALTDRPVYAGLMLGAAVSCKQWAIIATLPVVLAAPRQHLKLLVAAGAAGAALLAPVILAEPGGFAAAQKGVISSEQWFRPRQLWWPFGTAAQPGPDVPVNAAVTPDWLAPIPKPLIVALTIPLALLWSRRPRTDALLLLALLLLLRCLLDPWNVVYYHLPLVVALVAWEVLDGRRIPVLSLLTTGAVWLTFESYDTAYGTGPWLAYLAWTIPLAAHLAYRLYRPSLPRLARTAPATA